MFLLQFFILLNWVLNISSYVQKNNFPRTVLILKYLNEQTKLGAYKHFSVRFTQYLTMTT